MGHSKEDLLKLAKFVNEIANEPGNEWFKLELTNLVDTSNTSKPEFKGDVIDISDRVKYLALKEVLIIDYDDISHKEVKNQLIRDCVEMGRYKLGKTDNSNDDFAEFCRYAHLQAEELINYFYSIKFNGKLSDIFTFITQNVPWVNPSQKPKSLVALPYGAKLNAFVNYFKIDINIFYELEFLNKVRNEFSHRNSSSENTDDEILRKCEERKISFFSTTEEIHKFGKEDKELYTQGKYIFTKRNRDFKRYYSSVEILKKAVVANLSPKIIVNINAKDNSLGGSNSALQDLKNKMEGKG